MKIPAVAILMLACLATTAAQNTPEWELFAGPQYMRFDTTQAQTMLNAFTFQSGLSPADLGRNLNLYGWNFSVQQNTNNWFGGVIEFSGNYGSQESNTTPVLVFQFPAPTVKVQDKVRFWTFMAGPQFTWRKSGKIQPFARALFGGVHLKTEMSALQTPAPPLTVLKSTAFAAGAGGGVDVLVLRRIALRAAADYIHSNLGEADTGNSVQMSVGVVFRIGSK